MDDFTLEEFKSRKGPLIAIDNIHIGQTPKTIEMFTKLIQLHKFELIIEIGTHKGGFTYFLNKIKPTNCMLVSYEINKSKIEKKVLNENIDIRICNCFDEHVVLEIKNMLNLNKKALLLCDGGNKTKEFNTFAQYIKSDDVIMLHDYAHTPIMWNTYARAADWQFAHETSYDDIKHSINTFNLTKHMHDEFCSVFWGCYIKT